MKVEEIHRSLLLKWANDWWFKAGVLSYSEEKLMSKVLHRTDEYSTEEKIELNEIRQKWIDYTQNGKHQKGMPDFLKKTNQSNLANL